MTIELSKDRERFVNSLLQAGRYASESEVIDEALRLLEQREAKHAEEARRVEAWPVEGPDSGPSTPTNSEDWDAFEREARRLINSRKAREA